MKAKRGKMKKVVVKKSVATGNGYAKLYNKKTRLLGRMTKPETSARTQDPEETVSPDISPNGRQSRQRKRPLIFDPSEIREKRKYIKREITSPPPSPEKKRFKRVPNKAQQNGNVRVKREPEPEPETNGNSSDDETPSADVSENVVYGPPWPTSITHSATTFKKVPKKRPVGRPKKLVGGTSTGLKSGQASNGLGDIPILVRQDIPPKPQSHHQQSELDREGAESGDSDDDDAVSLEQSSDEANGNKPLDKTRKVFFQEFIACDCTNTSFNGQVFAGMPNTVEFCQAREKYDGTLVGCGLQANTKTLLLRVSPQTTLNAFCDLHINRLRRHQCCPYCGEFCTTGADTIRCTNRLMHQAEKEDNPEDVPISNSETHLFHLTCASRYQQMVQAINGAISNWKSLTAFKCPHCGSEDMDNLRKVSLTVKTETPSVFLPEQKLLPPASISNGENVEEFQSLSNGEKAEAAHSLSNGEKAEAVHSFSNGEKAEAAHSLSNGEKVEASHSLLNGEKAEAAHSFSNGEKTEAAHSLSNGEKVEASHSLSNGEKPEAAHSLSNGGKVEASHSLSNGEKPEAAHSLSNGEKAEASHSLSNGEKAEATHSLSKGEKVEASQTLSNGEKAKVSHSLSNGEKAEAAHSFSNGGKAEASQSYSSGEKVEEFQSHSSGEKVEEFQSLSNGEKMEEFQSLSNGNKSPATPNESLVPKLPELAYASVSTTISIVTPEANTRCIVDGANSGEAQEAMMKAGSVQLTKNGPPSDLQVAKLILSAIERRDLGEIFGLILAHDYPIDKTFKSRKNKTLMHLAVESRNMCFIYGTVFLNAELDVFDDNGFSPLMMAAKLNEPDIIKYLIASGSDEVLCGANGMNVLHTAVIHENFDSVREIVESYPMLINTQELKDGLTPLMIAAKYGFTSIAIYLIQSGRCDTLILDGQQNSAIHWAAHSGLIPVFVALQASESGELVEAQNSAGESPMDICFKQNQTALMMTILQTCPNVDISRVLAKDDTKDQRSQRTIIRECLREALETRDQILKHGISKVTRMTGDISNGREVVRISCVNTEDDAVLPKDFHYITELPLTQNLPRNPKSISESINSHNQVCPCNPALDLTEDSAGERIYDSFGRLFSEETQPDEVYIGPIFECNEMCHCSVKACPNRVVQKGSEAKLQVFRTKRSAVPNVEGKGWGVRTLSKIPLGSFICEYIGETLTLDQLGKLTDDSCVFYQPNLLPNQGIAFNSKYFGNVGRFLNHSCCPNSVPIIAFTHHESFSPLPRIALFASKEIQPYEEITFNYGPTFWKVKTSREPDWKCLCGTTQCPHAPAAVVNFVDEESE